MYLTVGAVHRSSRMASGSRLINLALDQLGVLTRRNRWPTGKIADVQSPAPPFDVCGLRYFE
jgi:hypothetical protein